MGSPCRSCNEREAVVRRVCHRCYVAIEEGRSPDVRSPSRWGNGQDRYVRSPQAVAERIAHTLARYPHLKRSS